MAARTGIFGGSFNPPHPGHVRAVQEMMRKLKLDRVLVIPAGDPPHKELPAGTPDGRTRLALTRIAFADVPGAEVLDIELERKGPSYTSDTLAELRKRWPKDRFYLLMGTDMFLSLHTWHRPDLICGQAVIAAARRVGSREVPDSELKAHAKLLQKEFGASVELVDNEVMELSSTQVRRRIAFDIADSTLGNVLMKKIRDDGLYGAGADRSGLPFEELRQQSLALHNIKRVPHVIGCSETAEKLARLYGCSTEDARRAGILHDITKALDEKEQLMMVERYGIIIDEFERENPRLLHAKTGAAAARFLFHENDNVCSAIEWHTTGREDMTRLEKILYIADYMEPTRDFEGVEKLREVTFRDLDEGVLLGLSMSVEELTREHRPLCQTTVLARDFLLRERNAEK